MSDVKKRKKSGGADNSFVTVCLLIAGVFALIKRVSLTNQIGDNGNAYFGMAYDTYLFLFLLTGYSVQSVLARMLAARCSVGHFRNGRKVWKVMLLLVLVMGTVSGLVMYFLGGILAKNVFGSVQAATAIECLAPLLLVSSLLGLLRGYFQGMGTMVPTAISRIIEEAAGLIALGSLTGWMMEEGTQIGNLLQNSEYTQAFGAAGAGLAFAVGCFVSILFLFGIYALFQKNFKRRERKDNGKETEEKSRILRTAVSSFWPVMLLGFIMYGSYLLDQILYFLLMPDTSGVVTQWGIYTGKYRILMSVPVPIVFACCGSLFHGLALSHGSRNSARCKAKAVTILKIALILALPMAVYLGIMSDTLMKGLFEIGDLDTPASLLREGCVSVFLQAVGVALAGILQAMDQGKKLLISTAAAVAVHVISLILFLTKLSLGIQGVVYSAIVLYALFMILNLIFVFSELSWRADWGHIIGTPVISAAVAGGVVFFMNVLLSGKVAEGALIFLTLFVGILLYLVMILMLHGVSERELRNLPLGNAVILAGKTLHFM